MRPVVTSTTRERNWRWSCAALLVVLGVGCQRESAYPADWVVQAKHPAEFTRWNARTFQRLPDELQQEFSLAITRISEELGLARKENDSLSKNPLDPFCRALDQRTIKQVILHGYDARLESLMSKRTREERNLAATVMRFDETAEVAKFERFIAYQRAVISRYEEEEARMAFARKAFLDRFP